MSMMQGVGFTQPLATASGKLIYSALQSPDYAANLTGWTINKDGSAQFNNLTVTGGTIQQGLYLFYGGVPANGNLVMSIAASAGTDSFGNAYKAGVTVYDTLGDYIEETFGAQVGWTFHLNGIGTDGFFNLSTSGTGAAQQPMINVFPPAGNANGAPGLSLVSESADGSKTGYVWFDNSDEIRVSGQTGSSVSFTLNDGTHIYGVIQFGVTGFSGIGSLTANKPGSSSPPVAETWHTPAVGAGWATGSADGLAQPVAYRLSPDGTVQVMGAIHSTSVTPSATLWSMPAGYIPAINQRFSVVEAASGSAFANYAGVTKVTGAVGVLTLTTLSGTDYYFDSYYRLS